MTGGDYLAKRIAELEMVVATLIDQKGAVEVRAQKAETECADLNKKLEEARNPPA